MPELVVYNHLTVIKRHKIRYYLKVYQLQFNLTAYSAFKRCRNYYCYNSHHKSALVTELKTVCSWGCNPKEAIERKILELLPATQDLGLFARTTSACELAERQERPHRSLSLLPKFCRDDCFHHSSGFSLRLF